MRLTNFILPLIVASVPYFAYAQDSIGTTHQSVNVSCEKTWMLNKDNSSDEVSFRDFGQKYCECTADQRAEANKSASTLNTFCLSRTILYLTMDNIGAEEGLSNLTADKIKASCDSIWNIINPNITTTDKQKKSQLCTCAAPKLDALTKDKDNYTDREWYAKINEIAGSC